MKTLLQVVLVTFGLCFATTSGAHGTNEAYIFLDVGTDSLGGRIEVRLPELVDMGNWDADDDGVLTHAEAEASRDEIYAFLTPLVQFEIDGALVPMQLGEHSFVEVETGDFMAVAFTTPHQGPLPDAIGMRFAPFSPDAPAIERGLVVIENNARTGLRNNEAVASLIFDPGSDVLELSLEKEPALSRFWMFLKNGIKHILEGHDHVAFVIALLLPSVLIRQRGEAVRPVPELKPGLITMLKVVTTFTIAHSITLSLAALNLVSYWSALVEFLIAASIFIVALQNIFGRETNWVYLIVFGLGLLHGFGFASVLAPYGTYQSELWLSLLGFNLGVEVGQAVIVLVLFPILFALRNWSGYRPVVNVGGSALLALVALYWMSNRMPYLFEGWT